MTDSQLATIAVTREGDVPVAVLDGEVDLSNADEIRRQLLSAATSADPALVLDLRSLVYLDSAGVRMLFELERLLGDRRQRLHLVTQRGDRVWRVLEITDTLGRVPVHADADAAVAAIAASPR